MDLSETGALIRQARKAAGLSQAQLAKRRHMSRTTLSLIETGQISEIGVRKLAALLDDVGLSFTVTPKRRPTLAEAFAQNERERAMAIKETTDIIRGMNR
ncbi:MAG: helix-turn-helix transcriptional regulator [Opitutaceae bacterium]|jgi:transcriptional regulator with XRE-family HTH domain